LCYTRRALMSRAVQSLTLLCLLLPLLPDCRGKDSSSAASPGASSAAPGPATPAMKRVHDHTPHHGGIVSMVGMRHVEALAVPAGRVRVYLTDLWRQPLPLDHVHGIVSIRLHDGWEAAPLSVAGDALEAVGPALTGRDVNAHVDLTLRDAESVQVNFLLPLAAGATGAAGLAAAQCVAPTQAPESGAAPRCTIQLDRPVTAIAISPDGRRAFVAAIDVGVTAWDLRDGRFTLAFAPPPPMTIASDEPPHPEAINAMAVRPDGSEVVVAVEGRLLVYNAATGELARELPGPGGVLRALAWSPDATTLLLTTLYRDAAVLLAAGDGSQRQHFAVEREAAAVAFSPNGRTVAVASDAGPITLFDAASGEAQHTFAAGHGAARALVFGIRHLTAAADDGVLRVWTVASGELLSEQPFGVPLSALAAAPDGRRLAIGGVGGLLQIYDSERGAPLETLSWLRTQVLGLAWGGTTLVAGDLTGQVALWDAPPLSADAY
jgi:WD40 repeat protein